MRLPICGLKHQVASQRIAQCYSCRNPHITADAERSPDIPFTPFSMVALPEGRAKTLKEAFQLCDVGPLKDEALQRYYVDLSAVRSSDAISSVSTRLEFAAPGQFRSVLFTGHRGSGKSTELRRLQKRWQTTYRVIYLETDSETDISDVDYTDLYLVIIKQVSDDLAKLGLTFDERLLTNFQKWFLEITEETEESVEKSVSLTASAEVGVEIPFLSKLLTKLLAQLKGSNVQKKRIRETLQQDIGRLKSDMNLLLEDAFVRVQQHGYEKGYLVIFDSLDLVPPIVGDRLYFDYATQLQELKCTVIYTVPISVVYSDKNLNNTFGSPNVVPMVNIYQFDAAGQQDPKYELNALKRLAQLITQRIEHKTVFSDDDLIIQLVAASGGHVRQLMQMTAMACLTAATRGHQKIEADDVQYAIQQEQINFERIIPSHHYSLLAEICKTKRIDQNKDGQKMLFNTSVLEYEGGGKRWNYVNPVVKNSIPFKEAAAHNNDDT
ncbi:ATP-binding protein [Oscillatoria sp. CS-180]|uniref:ATP-binding protein n=1 Tax=Oscillatoria sp. CS-180 TaxID=3021720 RepID=UPI00232BE87B|nr:ATP-binding protein [Oscillatoria sp. CS-180]MDB9525847.1 ATP-binding protein [Oscillatoria sp. CS-180]